MNFDISIIRPEMRSDNVKLRREKTSREKHKRLKRALQAFHTLETMAVNIYKLQISSEASEHNRLLIAAMGNEMTHLQDFQLKLYEYGTKPSFFRGAYWLVGVFIGLFSRLLGKRSILRAGIWVESKAVHHYEKLLAAVDWEEDTRTVILKDQADEAGHINRWRSLLAEPEQKKEPSSQN